MLIIASGKRAFPRDYVRRRRLSRRLSNALLVSVLSLGAAYLITRQPDTGFSVPQGSAALPSSPSSPVPQSRAADTESAVTAYKLQPGPYVVGELPDVVVPDSKRNKDLHVRVFYPSQPGRYPVILFSHGAGGSQTCCEALTHHWASYGYVTLQPTHDDSFRQRRLSDTRVSAGEDARFMQAVRDALKTPALWESRPVDISLLIDSLPSLQARFPELAAKLDTSRVGLAGHSMGSFTSEVIGGAVFDLPGRPATNAADPRVKAILCLSPQGPGQFGLTERSFDEITVPYLGITGSLDSLGPVASPTWHRFPFEHSHPGDKYQIMIQGANHMSFISARTLSPSRAPQAQSILDYTNSAALAFWDAYLKRDPAAKHYLQSDALEKVSQGAVELDRR
jgi:predicted dienelactone hydrolase